MKVFATCHNDVRVLVLGSFSYLFYVAFAEMAAISAGCIYHVYIGGEPYYKSDAQH